MVLHRNNTLEHTSFESLTHFVAPGDVIVLNDTKVMPVRLTGKSENGNTHEMLITDHLHENRYSILFRGTFTGRIRISEELEADIIKGSEAVFHCRGNFRDVLGRVGAVPLPPYIKRSPTDTDRDRYQTVFAEREGSIAAPTAGLHFTEEILRDLEKKGILIKKLTLHIGTGTFRPIRAKDISHHRMEEEVFEVQTEMLDTLEKAKERGNRVFLVGTTTTRALEAYLTGRYRVLHRKNGTLRGATDLFIHSDYTFKAPDALLTNFHLPNSTPLMLTAAFAGRKRLLAAYREAVSEKYGFYSYGDAMLIL